MTFSDQINEIAAALAKAQAEIQNVVKDAKNPHYGRDYASLDAITDTVRPVFANHGLAIVQIPTFADGHCTVETLITHSSGQWIRGDSQAPVSKADAQGVGSATTYLRRYSTAGVAALAQTDDDGHEASQAEDDGRASQAAKTKPAAKRKEDWRTTNRRLESTQKEPPKRTDAEVAALITEDQRTELVDIAQEHGWKVPDVKKLLKEYGVETSAHLPAAKYQAFKAALQAKPIPTSVS